MTFSSPMSKRGHSHVPAFSEHLSKTISCPHLIGDPQPQQFLGPETPTLYVYKYIYLYLFYFFPGVSSPAALGDELPEKGAPEFWRHAGEQQDPNGERDPLGTWGPPWSSCQGSSSTTEPNCPNSPKRPVPEDERRGRARWWQWMGQARHQVPIAGLAAGSASDAPWENLLPK